jgi:hypothetical protein
MICKDGRYVNEETGEVTEELCFEDGDLVEDHDLEHYSVIPPVPAVHTRLRNLAKENMKEKNFFLKGHELDLLIKRMKVIINYLESIYFSLSYGNQCDKNSKHKRKGHN